MKEIFERLSTELSEGCFNQILELIQGKIIESEAGEEKKKGKS